VSNKVILIKVEESHPLTPDDLFDRG